MKQALMDHAAANGITLSTMDPGKLHTDKNSVKELGVDQLPAWSSLAKLKASKKGIGTIEEYQRAAGKDGRLHSLINFTTVTGRTASNQPSLQNVPRDPRFRDLFKARPDHLILAVDYSAIELRIAAVLAERAIADLREQLSSGEEDTWFLRQVRIGLYASRRPPYPSEPENGAGRSIKWWEAAIASVSHNVLHRPAQTMITIFRRGLDPHLVTGIDLACRSGKILVGDNPVEWLASMDEAGRQTLKDRLRAERQAAKAPNFGLLYGMRDKGPHTYGISTFGLTWTLNEAAQARQAWFDMYPEFRLWHMWTNHCRSQKQSKDKWRVWGYGVDKHKLVPPSYDEVRLYTPSTLTGRPLAVLDQLTDALNHQDQGTGADILARAIASLPGEIAAMMLMPVHDELVFEVPVNNIENVKRLVKETMVRAGDEVLGGGIPVEVETVVGEVWRKA